MTRKFMTLLPFLMMLQATHSTGQQLWNLTNETWMTPHDETTLRSWVARKDERPFDPFITARQAAMALAHFYGVSERTYIISNMKPWIDSLRTVNAPLFQEYYFYLQYIKGYLGDPTAVAGMDSVVRFYKNPRYGFGFKPIELLAEAGHYDYFDTLRNAFTPANAGGVIQSIRLYGRDSRFRTEARSMIRQYILATPSNLVRFGTGASEMMTVDRAYGIQLLDSLFRASSGTSRMDYFQSLEGYDRDGQPDRVIWALPAETDTALRDGYVPLLGGGTGDDYISRKYLTPRFVKFVKDQLLVEPTVSVKADLDWFRTRFLPLPLPASVSVLSAIDSLISTKHQVTGYNWLVNSSFELELDSSLTNAHNYLVAGDSSNTGRQVKVFQQKVDAAHKDSLNPNRGINLEGWKFLFNYAKYILSALPQRTDTSSVSSGWNMVSLPVDAIDPRTLSVYTGAISPAYAYSSGYVTKDTLVPGYGYWLKYPSDKQVGITGFWLNSLSVPVQSGWNMVGSLSANIPKSSATSDTSKTKILTTFYGYKAGTGYFQADTIKVGKGYWVKMSAAGALLLNVGAGSASSAAGEQPPTAPGTPSVPILLSPTNGASGVSISPTLSWSTSSNASSYRLQVSTNSSFSTAVFDQSGLTGTSQMVSGLAYSTPYYWHVYAVNDFGASNWSNMSSFTTQAPPPPPPPCQCCNQSPITLDQITVSDANGNGQSMFVNNSGKRLALGVGDVEMPPEPGQGRFDARFQSKKLIESVPVGQGKTSIPIVIKNAVGSITIRWNIRADNKITYWLTDPGSGKVRQLLSGNGSLVLGGAGNGSVLIQAQATQPCQ